MPRADAHVRSGKWNRKEFVGTQLAGKTLGIIGLGRVGSAVAQRALAFEWLTLQNPLVKRGEPFSPLPGQTRPGLRMSSKVMHLFAYRPERTDHLSRFTQAVMRGPSPLSPGLRELIAAFTSRRNDCLF